MDKLVINNKQRRTFMARNTLSSKLPHDLHQQIAKKFKNYYKSKTDFELLIDPACGGNRNLPFFIGQSKSFSTEFTDVDLFVAKNEEVILVCEIDESNTKPGHIFGKFISLITILATV